MNNIELKKIVRTYMKDNNIHIYMDCIFIHSKELDFLKEVFGINISLKKYLRIDYIFIFNKDNFILSNSLFFNKMAKGHKSNGEWILTTIAHRDEIVKGEYHAKYFIKNVVPNI